MKSEYCGALPVRNQPLRLEQRCARAFPAMRARQTHRLLQTLLTVVAALMLWRCAFALPPDVRLTQLYHTSWTAKDGAPTGIESVVQTNDGYLWIATSAGLFRFDGMRFERIDSIRKQPLPSNNIMTLFAPRSGGLWIGYRFGGASFIEARTLTSYGEREGLGTSSVTRFVQDQAGIVWATSSGGLKRFDGSRWQDVRATLGVPSQYVRGIQVATDGSLWIVTGHSVMVLRPGASRFAATPIQTSETDVDFVTTSDGTLWLMDASRGARAVYVPGDGSSAQQWIELHDPRHGTLLGKLVDRDGALWMTSSAGIHRLKDFGRLLDPRLTASAVREVFSELDGLSARYAAAFLEDHEGNVWIGTAGGLDRFRAARLTRVDLPRAANGFAIAAGDAGALLVGIDFKEGAYQVTGKSTVAIVPGPGYINCAYRADDGAVWLGGPGVLWYSNTSPPGEPKWLSMALPVDRANADYYPVQAITKDRAGQPWVSLIRGGVFHRIGQDWTRVGDTALSMAGGEDGYIWLGYPNNRIQLLDVDRNIVRELTGADGLDLGNVMSILARRAEAWVGGERGLMRFDGRRFHAIRLQGGLPLPSVSGIVLQPEGDLWLSTSQGAMKIAADEVQRWSLDPRHPARYTLFDFLDGMPGTPNAIRPLPSIAAGTDGRLWFATTNGIVWLDPKHLGRNSLAPNVQVQSIVADGRRYESGPDLRLPIRTRNLQITYTALSLSIPERVRFRYQLGAGEPWQDAGVRRTAYFTNLAPGRYVFRVTAANDDGVWNETGTSLELTLPPAFYQTRWFRILCALAALALLTIMYRARMRQVAARVRERLEARLAERERIARELHDTLLQGMQGLIWRFQAAADRIPASEPARQLMEQSLDRADQLLGESRDKVKDLRPGLGASIDLAEALAAEGQQFAQLHGTQFRASASGARRDLHPIVREEGLLIAREALSNAFRHAHATNIEVEVTYGDAALQVRVRDDGQGISAAVRDAGGRPGHFGLIGMQERAKKLAAHLEVWSKPGAGTEIDLRVPAAVAYRRRPGVRSIRSWFTRLYTPAAEH